MLSYLAQSETGQNPLIPALPEFIIGTIVFLVVFGVLAKMLMPRIQQTLSERTEMIEGGLARSDEAQAEAKQLLDQYREQLAGARHEAARLREEAREQGAQIIAEMREQAQAEARRVTEAAQAQIEADRQQALTSLRAEVGTLATELASRIVGESLTDVARQTRMVDRFLDELDSADGGAAVGARGAGEAAGQATTPTGAGQ
jgi:F-type H+-transporting ATPase subunit b